MQTQADELLLIDTPENVVFGYEVAGIGSRFLAALVDTTIIGVLVGVVFFTAAMALSALDTLDSIAEGGGRAAGIVLGLASFLIFVFLWGYYVFFELLWNGQSPGKRWVGLRVIGNNGQPVSITEAALRNLVRIIDLLPGTYGIGIVTMFLNDQSRRLGDFAAGTLVVYERGAVTLETLDQIKAHPLLLRPEQEAMEQVAELPLERLKEADVALVESFLERHHDLDNRETLARQLIDYLFRQMELEPRPVRPATLVGFLEAVVYRKRAGKNGMAPGQERG